MASADVFRAYLQPPKSMMDYQADYDRADANKLALLSAQQQLEAGRFDAQMRRQNFAQGQEKYNAIRALYADPALAGDQKALEARALTNPLTVEYGRQLQKDRLAAEKAQADIGHLGAQTANQAAMAEAAQYKTRLDKASKAIKDIAAFRSPQEAFADLQAKAQTGEIPPEHVAAISKQLMGISTPEQWQQWQQMTRYRLLDAKDQLEQEWKAKAEQRALTNDAAVNANRDLVPDGRGGWTVNEQLVGAKSRIAQAGASVTMGTPLAVTLPDGTPGYVQPANRPGAAPTILRLPPGAGGAGGNVTPPPQKLPEAAQKQVTGARNLQDAVDGYLARLEGWKKTDMLSPDARKDMGNAYNNMMLQAKEAYNLGVLNGPDYDILQQVVADPTKWQQAVVSNEALAKQAADLRKIAGSIEKTVVESHGMKYTPRPQTTQPKAAFGLDPSAIDAELARRRGK